MPPDGTPTDRNADLARDLAKAHGETERRRGYLIGLADARAWLRANGHQAIAAELLMANLERL